MLGEVVLRWAGILANGADNGLLQPLSGYITFKSRIWSYSARIRYNRRTRQDLLQFVSGL